MVCSGSSAFRPASCMTAVSEWRRGLDEEAFLASESALGLEDTPRR
jgi:hypothetical protein